MYDMRENRCDRMDACEKACVSYCKGCLAEQVEEHRQEMTVEWEGRLW